MGDVSISGLGRRQFAVQAAAPEAITRREKTAAETGANAGLAPRSFTANATRRRGPRLAADPFGLEPAHSVEVNVPPGTRMLVRTNLATAAIALQVLKKTANARPGFRSTLVYRTPSSKSNVSFLWPPATMAAVHTHVAFASLVIAY